jgi:choline kinase
MTEDFLLLNGDTLFEDDVLRSVLEGPKCDITVTVNEKSDYDEDDMKVTRDAGGQLRAIGKKLSLDDVDAESIGMLLYRDAGVAIWRDTLEKTVRSPAALNLWYLSVVNELAQNTLVNTAAITGMWWQEIDSPEDLQAARAGLLGRDEDEKDPVPIDARASSF